MKIYKIEMCLRLVLPRLKKFKLYEYNSQNPIIFVQAADPDDACYRATHNLLSTVFKQDMSRKTVNLLSDLMHDVRILKVSLPKDR